VLPAEHRLTRSADFAVAVRRGPHSSRVAGPLLVVHAAQRAGDESAAAPARVGFVVSKAVGGAVVRNRVKRRLRHLVAHRLATVPAGSTVVVRALPAAATANGGALAHALTRQLSKAVERAGYSRATAGQGRAEPSR
jgi:ribonuclease P protein component